MPEVQRIDAHDTTSAASPPLGRTSLDVAALERQLREALAARAARLGLDPTTIASPSPGALIARSPDGMLLRLDFQAYAARDLER